MSRLFDTYRAVHEQGFVPIFVSGSRDQKMLVEVCAEAGVKVIEYTLRRADAPEMIPWIRRNYPDLYLLVGSTIDDEYLAGKARARHPQMRTLSELAEMGADGFVSMLGWNLENIRRWSPTHVVAPTAMTLREAFIQLAAGAHFVKMLGPGFDLVRLCRAEPTYGICPIMLTGGMTPETIPDGIKAGAMTIGTGWEVMLNDLGPDATRKQATDTLKAYLESVRSAREKYQPELLAAIGADRDTWLRSLPHMTPFDPDGE